MSTLTTYTHRTPAKPGCFRVCYRVGTHRQGAIMVDVGDIEDGHLAAELAAIHHLMFRLSVLGASRTTAKGTTIIVSAGAIPKLLRGKSSKAHLVAIAAPLVVQASDATWRVEQSADWIDPAVDAVHVTLDTSDMRPVFETSMGRIRASMHAVARLCERSNHQSLSEGLRCVRQLLNSGRLKRVHQSIADESHAARRHGAAGEKFLDPETGWVLVMRRHDESFDLVTAYAATGAQRLNSKRPTTAPIMSGARASSRSVGGFACLPH